MPMSESTDTRVALRAYAALLIMAGVVTAGWAPLWLGSHLHEMPWRGAALIRMVGPVLLAAGVFAVGLTACLHLSHATGEKSVRPVATPDGLLVVDYNGTGQPVGGGMTAPRAVSLERVNDLLVSLRQPPMADHEFKQDLRGIADLRSEPG